MGLVLRALLEGEFRWNGLALVVMGMLDYSWLAAASWSFNSYPSVPIALPPYASSQFSIILLLSSEECPWGCVRPSLPILR
ncbi:hypothetical protein BD413DRAFT_554368 [Trametes elegans]|nr:hypothetical protein BD413DRAFT_554368 [Trametes elegans]